MGSDPTYRDYGYPQYFATTVDLAGVANGGYQLVLRVKNPLEAVSANAKSYGSPTPPRTPTAGSVSAR